MPFPRPFAVLASSALLALLAGCGGSDDNADAIGEASSRTIDVEMRDNAFSPDTVSVEAGETVRFVFENTGDVIHEAYVGDAAAQEEHASEMASMGDMHHDGDDVLVLDPGEVGDLTHTFAEAGVVQIGCHQPGHYEAGMVLDVEAG